MFVWPVKIFKNIPEGKLKTQLKFNCLRDFILITFARVCHKLLFKPMRVLDIFQARSNSNMNILYN